MHAAVSVRLSQSRIAVNGMIPRELRYNRWLVQRWSCGPLRESAIVKSTGNLPDNPIQPLEKVVTGYRTTWDDIPLMGLDRWEVQRLKKRQPAMSAKGALRQGTSRLACSISLSVKEPCMSCLLAKTSNDAPANL
jgi:hypothetical protein